MTRDAAFIIRTREAWLAQARAALDALEALGITVEGKATSTLAEALKVPGARGPVAELLQAFDALGVRVAPDLLTQAGLRPVGEVLELP